MSTCGLTSEVPSKPGPDMVQVWSRNVRKLSLSHTDGNTPQPGWVQDGCKGLTSEVALAGAEGHTHTRSLSLTHTLSLSLTHSLSRSLSLTHTHTHTISLSHTLSRSLTHNIFLSLSPNGAKGFTSEVALAGAGGELALPTVTSLTHTNALSLSLSLSVSLSLSLFGTHTHTNTHTHTHDSKWLQWLDVGGGPSRSRRRARPLRMRRASIPTVTTPR